MLLGVKLIKVLKVKDEDWDKIVYLATLKQLTSMRKVPLHEVVTDFLKNSEVLEYSKNKEIVKLKQQVEWENNQVTKLTKLLS